MNSFESFLKFIGSLFAAGFVLAALLFMILAPILIAIFGTVFVVAFVRGTVRAYDEKRRLSIENHPPSLSHSGTRVHRSRESGKGNGKAEQRASEVITLSNGTNFKDPEARIREYCDIEVYHGYDDRHAMDDRITVGDLAAANKLYAMIDRYDPSESSRIMGATQLEPDLAAVPDVDLMTIDGEAWSSLAPKVRALLNQFLTVKGVGLAKATKILHLKRPHLFPVLDSFVLKFLSGSDPVMEDKGRLVELGLRLMDVTRQDLRRNRAQFRRLGERLANLPIQLTPVRMYDILCWTQEKWVNRGNTHAEYGTAAKSL